MLDGLTIDDIACLQALEQTELATLRNKELYSIYLGVANNIAYFISFQFDIFTWASAKHTDELNVPLDYSERCKSAYIQDKQAYLSLFKALS